MEIATVFESEPLDDVGKFPFPTLIQQINEYLELFCKREGIQTNTFIGKDGKPRLNILFNGTKIGYKLYLSNSTKRYFLSFFPINIWKKESPPSTPILDEVMNNTINFFEKLTKEIKLGPTFKKCLNIKNIDISGWEFNTEPDVGEKGLQYIDWEKRYNRIGLKILKEYERAIEKIPIFFMGKIGGGKKHFDKIKDMLAPIFTQEPVIYDNILDVKEILTKNHKNQDPFIFFFGTSKEVGEFYDEYKTYLTDRKIPSQFVNLKNAMGENIIPYGQANIILEILKKCDKNPLSVEGPRIPGIDCFLYITDINQDSPNKYFGVSVNFSEEGQSEELVNIYNGINYESAKGSISFGEGSLSKLSEKISSLSPLYEKNVYVVVSKLWKIKDIEFICNELEKKKIHVKKFVYLASKANRFIFSSILDEKNNVYNHPYILWDSKCASFMTNSKKQFYGSIFPFYVETLRKDETISELDLETILWLVKKRIYRIAAFYKLRTPELLSLFKQFKKMPLEKISELEIPLGMLI